MAPSDSMMILMMSWTEQRDSYAKQLEYLARERESLKEKCDKATVICLLVLLVGLLFVPLLVLITMFTDAQAAPLLAGAAVFTGVALGVNLTANIIQGISSSSNLKIAEKIEKESNKIAEKIQRLTEQLKARKD